LAETSEHQHDGMEHISPDEFDQSMMHAALDLARRGSGYVSPNPMVGAVIVDKDRRIIGEGWHKRYGTPHAEINAITSAAGQDLSNATLYVTLEPCSHFGKTPPCSDAIIAAGIRRVVVAMRDPNPLVSGQGNRRMREAGIQVEVGLLEHEARALNETYIHFISTGMPFVAVKMAQTLDGFTALPSGESKWITGEQSRRRVHLLRATYDAAMVGTQTAIMDNPTLTVRYGIEARHPKRITIDRNLIIPDTHYLFSDPHTELTHLFTTEENARSPRAMELADRGVHIFDVPDTPRGLNLSEILRTLAELNIASVLVEGGSRFAGALIREDLVSKIILFVAPKLFGHGFGSFPDLGIDKLSEAYQLNFTNVEPLAEDLLIEATILARG